eukprot:33903-Eustigmatos_ZCMA.PRE.1
MCGHHEPFSSTTPAAHSPLTQVYAVVRGGGTSSVSKKGKKGSEGGRARVKLVDKRMKKDARGMAKVGKGGKRKGGGKKAGKKGKR